MREVADSSLILTVSVLPTGASLTLTLSMKLLSFSSVATDSLIRECGRLTSVFRTAMALRIRVSISAIGSVVVLLIYLLTSSISLHRGSHPLQHARGNSDGSDRTGAYTNGDGRSRHNGS